MEVSRSAPVWGLTPLIFAICLCAFGSFWLILIFKRKKACAIRTRSDVFRVEADRLHLIFFFYAGLG